MVIERKSTWNGFNPAEATTGAVLFKTTIRRPLHTDIEKNVVLNDTSPVVVAARLNPFHVLFRSSTISQLLDRPPFVLHEQIQAAVGGIGAVHLEADLPFENLIKATE
jgi:hypothetical protein